MKHFSREEWILLKKDEFDKRQREQMEAHLTSCEFCLDIFLSLIDDEDISQGEKCISPDFTDSLFFELRKIQKPIRKHGYPREKKKNLFIYYMAASMVTLILMNGGLFQSIAGPEIFNTSKRIENKVSVNWPEKVVSGAHNWILNFEVDGRGGFNFE